MRRFYAIIGVLLFAAGVLIAPALHKLYDCECDEHGESHSSETCAICQISSTPLLTCHMQPIIQPAQATVQPVTIPNILITNLFIPENRLARAPPLFA